MNEFDAKIFISENSGLNVFETIEKAYHQGRDDEFQKFIEVVNGAGDVYDAMHLFSQYIHSKKQGCNHE